MSACHLSQHSPKVWFQPVSSPQHIGKGQKTQELQGFSRWLDAWREQASQHSCADAVRCLMPNTTATPPVSEWGSSLHTCAVVTPGQSSGQEEPVSGPVHEPSPQHRLDRRASHRRARGVARMDAATERVSKSVGRVGSGSITPGRLPSGDCGRRAGFRAEVWGSQVMRAAAHMGADVKTSDESGFDLPDMRMSTAEDMDVFASAVHVSGVWVEEADPQVLLGTRVPEARPLTARDVLLCGRPSTSRRMRVIRGLCCGVLLLAVVLVPVTVLVILPSVYDSVDLELCTIDACFAASDGTCEPCSDAECARLVEERSAESGAIRLRMRLSVRNPGLLPLTIAGAEFVMMSPCSSVDDCGLRGLLRAEPLQALQSGAFLSCWQEGGATISGSRWGEMQISCEMSSGEGLNRAVSNMVDGRHPFDDFFAEWEVEGSVLGVDRTLHETTDATTLFDQEDLFGVAEGEEEARAHSLRSGCVASHQTGLAQLYNLGNASLSMCPLERTPYDVLGDLGEHIAGCLPRLSLYLISATLVDPPEECTLSGIVGLLEQAALHGRAQVHNPTQFDIELHDAAFELQTESGEPFGAAHLESAALPPRATNDLPFTIPLAPYLGELLSLDEENQSFAETVEALISGINTLLTSIDTLKAGAVRLEARVAIALHGTQIDLPLSASVDLTDTLPGGSGGSGSLNGECKCVVGPNDRCTKGLWDALQSPPPPRYSYSLPPPPSPPPSCPRCSCDAPAYWPFSGCGFRCGARCGDICCST